MAVDNRNPQALAPLRIAGNMAVYPLLVGVDLPQNVYQQSSNFLSLQQQLAQENLTLKQQAQIYAAQQAELESILAENQRLRTLLNAVPREGYTFSMGEVLTIAQDVNRGLVTLNKGSGDGVYEGQVVLEGGQIYGQVTTVSPINATVMQLIDREHSIPVQNQRTGERGLANGNGRGMPLEIKNLPASSAVKEGDIFVSSGLGGLFPSGFAVAKVPPNGVQFKQGDPFVTVFAEPLVDYEKVREVLLVWPVKPASKTVSTGVTGDAR